MDAGQHARAGPARRTFGPYLIDAGRHELTRDGMTVALRPKTFALLQYLLDRPGHVVSKQELLDGVWPNVIVSDDSLTQAVSELRSALGDRQQQLIRTIPRRGYLFETRVLPANAASPAVATRPLKEKPRPLPLAVVSICGTVVLSVVAAALVHRESSPPRPQAIGAAILEGRSLAVMPFTDLSDPPAPHVALAVDTELTTDLGRLADIRVTARGSAAALGDSASADAKRVGKALNVRYVVTGSVKRQGEGLHITAQLARTDTGELLWTERFDYVSAADWMARRDVSARIANVFNARIRDAALQHARRATPNNAAVEHWMRGAWMLSRVKTRADLLQARSEFEAAVAAQPDSSHALARLSMTYREEVLFRWIEDPNDRQGALEKAEALARRSLAIDAANQDGMFALSAALVFNGRIDEAMAITRRNLELNPNDAAAHRDLAVQHYFAGRWEEAVQQAELAMRLNPIDPKYTALCESLISTALIPLHRYDEAIEHARRIVDGPRAGGFQMIASAEAWRGNLDAARAASKEALKRNPKSTISRDRSLRGSKEPAYLAGMDHYYEGLRRADYPEGGP